MRSNADRIAIYSRKSKFTGRGESIGNQIELCRDYVKNLFGEEYKDRIFVFEDEGYSGGNLRRPDFKRMMERVRRREFRAIIVYRLDRISRNISDFTNLIDELTKLNVSFVSIREQFDTSTPMGRAMMFIISVFSQLERETIAERIRDNMHELAKTGRWLGGNTPTGYESECVTQVTIDGKARKACRLKVIREEGELVKTIFDIFENTDSLTATEAELLRRRVKTKRGKDFTRFAIKGILQNPVYMVADAEAYEYFIEKDGNVCSGKEEFDGTCGVMVYNRTEQEKGKTTLLLPVSEWIISVGKHQGLIPSTQWIKIQNSLERNKSKAYRKPRSNEALLTGILFCGCGERMYPKLSKRETADGDFIYTYVCKLKERSKKERCSTGNASGNALDKAVMDQIKMLVEDDSTFINQLQKRRRFGTGMRYQYEIHLSDLMVEREENEKKIEGLIDSLSALEGSMAINRVADRIEYLSKVNREIGNQIRECERKAFENALNDEAYEMIRQTLAEFGHIVDEMSVEEKRNAARTLVDRVVWDGVHAHVYLHGAEVCRKDLREDSK